MTAPAVSGTAPSQRLDLGRGLDQPQFVAQPLNQGAAGEHAALVGVGQAVRLGEGHSGEQVFDVGRARGSGVLKQEATGAVGHLGGPAGHGEVTKERGLLVAGDPADRRPGGDRGVGTRDCAFADRGDDLGQRLCRNAEQLGQFGRPAARIEVHQQGTGSIGCVGEVRATGQSRNQPGIHGAEAQSAGGACGGDFGPVVEHPGKLAGAEVRAGAQAGDGADGVAVAARFQIGHLGSRTNVLPDDGRPEGIEGCRVPGDGGLALIGDADGGNTAGRRIVEGMTRALQYALPDLVRIVLDPTGPRVALNHRGVTAADDAGVLVYDQRGRARGALVDGENQKPAPQYERRAGVR